MARTNNLTDFLTDIAGAIKEKKEYPDGTKIAAADFDSEIASIDTLNSEEIMINPTTSVQVVEPSEGKNAIIKATVEAVTSDIDSNIQAENIKSGVTILGVEGTLQEGTQLPDGIFIQEDIPTKTTSEALWLKRADESDVLNSNLFDLNDDVFGNRKWSWFINALTNAGYLEDFNKCKNVFIFRGQTGYSMEVFAADKIYINKNDPSDIMFYGLGTTIYFKTSDWSTYIYKAENGYASSNFYSSLNASNYYSLDAIYRYNNGYTTNIILPKNQPIQNPEDGIYIENNNVKSIVYVDKGSGTGFTKILDTSKADATAENILEGKTAFVNNEKLTGTMVNNGELVYTPTTEEQTSTKGYYNSIKVNAVTADIDANITPENIKKDITILGVTGTAVDANLTTLEVLSNGTYTPPEGYDGFNQVTVTVPDTSPNIFIQTDQPTTKHGIWINANPQTYTLQEIDEYNSSVNYGANKLLVIKGFDVNTKISGDMTYYFSTVLLSNADGIVDLSLRKYYGNGSSWIEIEDGFNVLTPEEAEEANSTLDDILGQPDQGDTDNLTPEEDIEANEIADYILGNSSSNQINETEN